MPAAQPTKTVIAGPAEAELQCRRFEDLSGFGRDDLREAFSSFLVSAIAVMAGVKPTRPGKLAGPHFRDVCAAALSLGALPTYREARDFFLQHFRPWRIAADWTGPAAGHGLVTGYYEPEVEGALEPSALFSAPILARPDDLLTFAPGGTPQGLDPALSAGRWNAGQRLEPYPDRKAIEAGAIHSRTMPLVWLRDGVEVFLIQVQGSARVRLPDGRLIRLSYAGRNGQPYTSIGRILIERGEISEAAMSLATLKRWLRDAGIGPGDAGCKLMQRNQSYVFFKIDDTIAPESGPIGAAGTSLLPLRSIAVDRTVWHYGLPFWVEAQLPFCGTATEPFQRLMVAQDTGSAIVGAARADIFFGSGARAGELAGGIRHPASFHVLLPRKAGDSDG